MELDALPTSWMDRLDLESNNISAALEWAVEHVPAETAMPLWQVFDGFWFTRGFTREGITLVRALVLDSNNTDVFWHTLAHVAIGDFAMRMGDIALAIHSYREASDSAEYLNNTELVQYIRGGAAFLMPPGKQAVCECEKVLQTARELGNKRYITFALYSAGVQLCEVGSFDRAEAVFMELATLEGMSQRILAALGEIDFHHENYDQAYRYFQQAMELARHHNDRIGIADMHVNLARVSLRLYEKAQTQDALSQAFPIYQWVGNDDRCAQCICLASQLAWQQNDPERAVSLMASIEQLRLSPPIEEYASRYSFPREYDNHLEHLRAQVDPSLFDKAWNAGRALTLDQAVEEVIAGYRAVAG